MTGFNKNPKNVETPVAIWIHLRRQRHAGRFFIRQIIDAACRLGACRIGDDSS